MRGRRFGYAADHVRQIDAATVEVLLELAGPDAAAPYLVELRHFGGALSRPPRIPNAVGRRDGAFCVYTGWVVTPGRHDELRAAQARLHERLLPWSTGGVCLNFLTGPDVSLEVLRSAYMPSDFERLMALEKQYDPEKVFRINHNIPVAGLPRATNR